MSEVEEVCDRVIFLDKGKIIADNTPEKLAQSIELVHIVLLISDGLKKTTEFCKRKKYFYKVDGRYLRVDMEEKNISQFLQELASISVIYDQISIDKPTLEDYFLQVVAQKKGKK